MPDLPLKPDILPPEQRRLWDSGLGVPAHFVLYAARRWRGWGTGM